jgi:predicted metal-binding protein
MAEKDYLVVVQCEIVKQRCSGYHCEQAFHGRTGGFAASKKGVPLRMLAITCGGCCGKALQRKLTHLARRAAKVEGIGKDRMVVQFASCITKDNFHSPRCLFVDYMKDLAARAGFDVREDTQLDAKAESRRAAGAYGRPKKAVRKASRRPK